MAFLPSTASRVADSTPEETNRRIRRDMELRVANLAGQGVAAIEERLLALDREWDVERYLGAGASSLSLVGAVLGSAVHRKWFLLPAAVAACLLQHTLQGWSPALASLRKIGVRTAGEINLERYVLKAIRGDFAAVQVGGPAAPQQALEAADMEPVLYSRSSGKLLKIRRRLRPMSSR